jgi:hypothetical protein
MIIADIWKNKKCSIPPTRYVPKFPQNGVAHHIVHQQIAICADVMG